MGGAAGRDRGHTVRAWPWHMAAALLLGLAGSRVQAEPAPAQADAPSGPVDEADGPAVSSLVEAVGLAYATAPGLLAERARAGGTRYRIAAAQALAGPAVTYQGRYGYQHDRIDTLAGPVASFSGWTSSASAILSQPLFTFGRNASDLKVAQAQSQYQDAVLRSAEVQTLLAAITAYAGLVRDRGALVISEQYLATLERELSDNIARFRKREVTETDVYQAKTRVELGREQVLGARRQADASAAEFIGAIGRRAGTLQAPNPIAVPATSLEQAIALADEASPVLDAARAREKVSRFQAAAARSEFLPRVDLRGSAEIGAVTPYSDNLRQRRLSGEVVVSGPLFDGGLRHARLAEAQAANDADWRLIDAASRDIQVQVADAWNLWRTQAAAADRLQQAIAGAERAFSGVVVQERAGLRSTLDVLDLARDLLIVRSNYNTASALAYIAQARLLAAMGLLTASDLLPADVRAAAGDDQPPRRARTGLPLLTPLLLGLDGVATGSSRQRAGRDPAAGLAGPESSTRLDLGPDLEVPRD